MALLSKFLATQRYATIAPYIKGDILDLGCNNASVFENFNSSINSYYGVERSLQKVEELENLYPSASFSQRDLDTDPLEIDKKFDCVLMVALIEHLFNQKFVMEEVAKVLKPNGVILITTPTPLGNDIVHRLGAYLGLFSKLAVDDHIVIYNSHRFKILANEVNLKLVEHKYFQCYCNQVAILENEK